MNIVVSIDCITYNHEKYISKALDSFIMQKTNFNFEILIHDDASTDGTVDIIREYQKKYPDIIKPILQNENQYSKMQHKRMSHTFNYPRAKGKYIAMCEGDDYWIDPYKLQKQVDFMETHPGCSMCYHGAQVIDVTTNTKVGYIKPYNKTFLLPSETLFLGGGHICPTASIMYVKDLMSAPPSFFWESPVGDHAYALVLSNLGEIGYINEIMSVRNLWVSGSWNTTHTGKQATEKMVNHLSGMIKLLVDYNEFTNNKWQNQIDKIILIWKIQISKLIGDNNLFKTKEVKRILKKLNVFDRMQFYLRYNYPSLFEKIKHSNTSIKEYFKNVEVKKLKI